MTHQPHPPFFATAGSRTPKIVFVGEAWGTDEDLLKKPFVGESGKELMRMLGEAFPEIEPELHSRICDLHRYGLAWVRDREEWFEAAGLAFTNVLAFRPPDNNLERLCGTKKEVEAEAGDYRHPPITKGKYLRPDYLSELGRLEQELSILRPNLILALGNTACWALLGATNIGSIRGAITQAAGGGPATGCKVLPTYHPTGVLRQWAWRPIVVADLMKGKREGEFSEIRRPERRILINPTLDEALSWLYAAIDFAREHQGHLFAADTETEARQITCISFASRRGEAIVIPFWDKTKSGWSYWPEHEERVIWHAIEEFVEDPAIELLWQNGLYDFQYMTPMKIKVHRSKEDTMLLHHALYPELNKGLGFLGSLYTNEASWKLMRRWKPDSEKRDE